MNYQTTVTPDGQRARYNATAPSGHHLSIYDWQSKAPQKRRSTPVNACIFSADGMTELFDEWFATVPKAKQAIAAELERLSHE